MKNLKTKWGLIGLLLIATTVFAAKFSENILIIGKGLIAEDTTIVSNQPGSNDPFQRYDVASQRWVFSNDGVSIKNLGSGSGSGGAGGVNILVNPGFEDGVIGEGWAQSGVSASQQQFTNSIEGNENFARMDFSAAAQYFESDLTDKPDSLGVGCSAQIEYTGGDNLIDIIILDGSSNELARSTLVARTEWGKITPLHFECASQMKIRLEATGDASQIDVDNIYLGSSLGVTSSAPEKVEVLELLTRAGVGSTASRIPYFTTVQQDNSDVCFSYTNDSTNGLQITVLSSECEFQFSWETSPGGVSTWGMSLNASNVTSSITALPMTERISHTSRVSGAGTDMAITPMRTFNVNDIVRPHYGGTTSEDFPSSVRFYVYARKKSEALTTFLPESQSFFYKGAFVSTGGASATFVNPVRANLGNCQLNNIIGTANITCSDGTSGGTLECTPPLEEQQGIKIYLPTSGRYKVCMTSTFSNGSTNVYAISKYINETNTISVNGRNHVRTAIDDGISVCESFDVNAAGDHTFQMEVVQANNSYNWCNNANSGITVEKIQQDVVAPVLIGGGMYHDNGAVSKRLKYRRLIFGGGGSNGVCTSTPCTIREISAGWSLDSTISVPAGGRFEFTMPAGTFKNNEYISCDCSAMSSVDNVGCNFNQIVLPQFGLQAQADGSMDWSILTVANNGTLRDAVVSLECISEE